MNKLKKVFISFGTFIIGFISKVYALEPKYGIAEPEIFESKPTFWEKFLSKFSSVGSGEVSISGKIVIPVILFCIGLCVILSKKITKKVKTIVVSSLAILAILGIILMN